MEKKMNNKKALQIITKMGKILSKLVFIFSIVCVCMCVAGLISSMFKSDRIFKIGNVTIHGLLPIFDGYNEKSINIILTAYLIIFSGKAVVSKFAERYFHNTLIAETPFTQSGAIELRKLGIITIVIPTSCVILAEILQEIMIKFMNLSAEIQIDLNFGNETSVILGIMFIVGSFLCGAEAD